MKPSDIQELDIKSDKLAFKIAVPKNKINVLISPSIWGKGIKAEMFNPRRPKMIQTPKGAKPNANRRVPNRYQKPFRDTNPTTYRPSYNHTWARYPDDQYNRDQYQRSYGY